VEMEMSCSRSLIQEIVWMLGNFKLVANIVRSGIQEFSHNLNTAALLKRSATRRRKRVYLRMESFTLARY
jgi:hypothetical protein